METKFVTLFKVTTKFMGTRKGDRKKVQGLGLMAHITILLFGGFGSELLQQMHLSLVPMNYLPRSPRNPPFARIDSSSSM